MRRYLRWVDWCLAHRKATVAAALAFFAASIALVPLLPTGLLPASDTGFLHVDVELPPGSSLADTLGATEAARVALAKVPDIAHVMATAGNGKKDVAADVRRGALTLVLADRTHRRSQAQVQAASREVFAGIPGARFTFGGSNDDERLELVLAGDDDAALQQSATALERELRSVPGLSNVASSASLERPEIVVRPDAERAAELGVSVDALAQVVRIATSGDFDARLSKLQLESRQLPIDVRVADGARSDLQVLGNLRVPARGAPVPLSSVASLAIESGPAEIQRYDRRRYVTLTASLSQGAALGRVLAEARALPAARHLPPGIEMSGAGNAENMKDLLSGFAIAMATGVLCVYCVLVLLFHDFAQPLTILCALPLSLGGAFAALLALGGQLNIPSLIGLVMLMGIVTKNSILLVEYAIVAMNERALGVRAAVLDACSKRARPIVMTTVAMVAGMLPIALGLGADAAFRQPMAVAVIGGLMTSTFLSLLVVPVVFSLVADVRMHVRRLRTLPGKAAVIGPPG
jgi:multidrug efflux pump subunit AcrB